MPDKPYTDKDLRAEAARQHATLTDDPDFMGVGEQMQDAFIDSTDDNDREEVEDSGSTWDEALDEDQFNEAKRKIHDLINGAADLSDWAVNLGADGLEPTGHVLSVGAGERTIARIHFAFEPGMDDDMRTALVEGVGQAIADAL
ncbi:hypothetical protein [Streptomyces sioyaensis]|uniref:hypothetical protein n=1 Tax=Streptomyces sioyaensis TaxID=67364 RepID=UPI003D74335C